MPNSISLNTQDPVFASRETKKYIWNTLGQKEAVLAMLLGKAKSKAMRVGSGFGSDYVTIGEFEVIQREIQTGNGSTAASIDPAASHTTAIGTTEHTIARTLYGDLTCTYIDEPISLKTLWHGGTEKKRALIATMTQKMTNEITDQIYGTGTGTDADGIYKWLSETADKWGLNTTTSANYYFRGNVESEAVGDFSEEMLRDWHRKCYNGELVDDSGNNQYSNTAEELFGLCDSITFQRIQKFLSDKITITQPVSPQQEVMKLGGFYKSGVTIDSVTYFPSIGLDRRRDSEGTEGELLILDPDTWEFIAFKGMAMDFLDSAPDRDLSKAPFNLPTKPFANVVWGEYLLMIMCWNMFCGNPRSNLAASLT